MNTAPRACVAWIAAPLGILLLCAAPLGRAQSPAAAPAAAPGSPNAPLPPSPTPAALPTLPVVPAASPGATPAAPSPSPTPAAQPAAPPHAAPRPLTNAEAVDSLSNGDVRQAIELIQTNYIDARSLTEDTLNRATLQGLLERLGPGAAIESGQGAPAPERFLAEILDDRIGYVRLGSLSQDSLAEFDATLGSFAEKKIHALILDLRATSTSRDFELAAEFIKRLTPKGKMLFAVRRPSAKQERMFTSSQEPSFGGVLVSVVGRNTSGAGEVIAAALRAVRNGMVVGQKTAGEAAEFASLSLRGGKRVRVAVGEVNLPGDFSIFPGGLKPDLEVNVLPKTEAEVLRLELAKGVSGLIFETERARLNEAALVAQTNPELDEYENYQKNGPQQHSLRDATLQRAVDLITTVSIFSGKTQ